MMKTFVFFLKWIISQALSLIAVLTAPFEKHVYAICGPDDTGKINKDDFTDIDQRYLPAGFRIDFLRNYRIVNNRFNFYYQTAHEKRLKTLREKYKLSQICMSAKNEFEEMLILMNWTRGRFANFEYQPVYGEFDGLRILDENRHDIHSYIPYRTYSTCHMLGFLYVQLLLAMGFQARSLSIYKGADLDRKGMHCIAEAWSELFKKWILLDPFLNIYYEKDGIPLNALEFHNTRYIGLGGIKVVSQDKGASLKGFSLEQLLKFYTYIRMEFRNDWMTNHYYRGHPKRSDKISIWWLDNNLPLPRTLSPKTCDPADIYWPLNRTEILIKKSTLGNGKNLELLFRTVTPNFRSFEVTIDEIKRAYNKEPFFRWHLHKGDNKISVAAVNEHDRKGVASEVVISKG